jgi:shikimate kinase
MLIFLIGYMGSGKSTIGAELARQLGLSFTDLDQSIEDAKGSTIAEIFAKEGEAHFRQLETLHLQHFVNTHSSGILAAGGGTACFNGNMDVMNEEGITIYLKCTADTLRKRLEDSLQRPLLWQSAFSLDNHLHEREVHYQSARYTITNDGKIKEAVDAILGLIKTASPSV